MGSDASGGAPDASVVIDAADIDSFWRDGVVCLRQVMPPAWLERMADPIERALADTTTTTNLTALGTAVVPDAMLGDRGATGPRGQFLAGTDHWKVDPDFADFALVSPLPAIVAQLLRSSHVYLYEDSVLVKEPGTREPTAFHQDMGYFHLEGDQVCTTWVPLDPVTPATGAVVFARGSHRWERDFRPNWFVSQQSMPDTDGEDTPDVFASPGEYDLITFDTQPGDITVHHARTLHGATANTSPTLRRRAISVRYCGDDARHHIRRGAPLKPHHHHMAEGDPAEHEGCPRAWPPSPVPGG